MHIDCDFVDHSLRIQTSPGKRDVLALAPKSVADSYSEVINALRRLAVDVTTLTRPVGIPAPIRFDQDMTRRVPMWSGSNLNANRHVRHGSYSHEPSSAGFWPGDSGRSPSSAVTQFQNLLASGSPASAQALPVSVRQWVSSCCLMKACARGAADPDQVLLEFLETTYAAAADLGGWDLELLEHRPACLCDMEGRPHPNL